jgi:hypothetical protein
MPRYVVERTFPHGLVIPMTAEGAEGTRAVVDANAELGVTWVQSFVTPDKSTSYCIYDGPSPDAIQAAAEKSGLPADRITEVRVLDPYFYL